MHRNPHRLMMIRLMMIRLRIAIPLRIAFLAAIMLVALPTHARNAGDAMESEEPSAGDPPASEPAESSAAESAQAPPQDGVDAFAIPEPLTIRVDDTYVVPALEASVWARRHQGVVKNVVLRFAVDRAEVLKLRPPHFGAEIDNVALLTMSPDRPVYLTAVARPELLKAVRAHLSKGGKIGGMALEKGDHGYPILFDLEYYTFESIVQSTGE